MGRSVFYSVSPDFGHDEARPRIFKSRPVGDVCLDIAKFAEDRDCRTLEYLMKLAAAEAYDCLDEPVEPSVELKSFGMWDWDVSSNLVYADTATARLFGVDPEKSKTGLDLRNFEANIYSDDLPVYSRALHAAAAKGGEFETRYRVISNGKLVWVYAKGSCLLSKRNIPTRFPGALIEI